MTMPRAGELVISVPYIVAVACVCSILARLLFVHLIYPVLLSPLSRIPNAHFTSPFTSAWISLARRAGRESRSIHKAHQRSGPIVRLGASSVSIASLDGLRKVYLGGFEKDPWYIDVFTNYDIPNMVSLIHRKPHADRKRMVSRLYSKSALFESVDLARVSDILITNRLLPLLDKEVRKPPHVGINVVSMFMALSIDFITGYMFGMRYCTEFLRDEPARQHYLDLCHTKFYEKPGHKKATAELEELCLRRCRAVDEYWRHGTMCSDDTNPVVYARLASELSKMTNDNQSFPAGKQLQAIASELFDEMSASQEDTAITLTYIVWHLSQLPKLQTLLRKELQVHLSPDVMSGGSVDQRHVHLDDPKALDSLKLLNAIILESLRLHPVTPGPQPRLTPDPGAVIEGFFIPGGTQVSTSSWCMHQNSRVFPEPQRFNPQRWLQNNGCEGSEEMRRWFWAFGSGGRMCVGKNFALKGGQDKRHSSSADVVDRDQACLGRNIHSLQDHYSRRRRYRTDGFIHRCTKGAKTCYQIPCNRAK